MSSEARAEFRWQLRSRVLELGSHTLVMGILNVTPDSFSDGGVFSGRHIERGLMLLEQGAHLLDIGGESTRPGANAVSAGEEQERVLSVIVGVLKERPDALISVDTYHASTARLAVEGGAEVVNDVSGHLWDEGMSSTCAALRCGNVLMHTRGWPQEWASLPRMEDVEVLPTVLGGLAARAAGAINAGVERESIVLDPGFGFGKMGAQNYVMLARFSRLKTLGFPLLAGLSRKGFLGGAVEQRVHATIAANTAAILAGAHIIRVHDVVPALEAAAVADAILAAG